MTDDAAERETGGSRDGKSWPRWAPVAATDRRLASIRTGAIRTIFGDATGLAVFLTAVVVLGAFWRIEFLMNDSKTVANLLVNVADGRLHVVDAPYSLTAREQPGLVESNGRLYGRNYGQVYLAVPVLWLLDWLAGLVDLRLLLGAAWSLAIVGLGRTVATILDRPRLADVGAGGALLSFAIAVLVATRIDWYSSPRPLVALGLTTLLVAAFGAVTLYRLFAWAHDRRLGVCAGLALVLATPVGFWGSFPKRHVLSATAVLVTCYLFAISRSRTDRRATLARAGAYATLGVLTSIHPFEAAFALAVLVPIDLLTAPGNDRRTFAVVAFVLLVSLTPTLATNAAISGDPFEPPRRLPAADGTIPLDPGSSGGPIGTDGGGTSGDGGDGSGGDITLGDGGGGEGDSGSGAGGSGFPVDLVPAPLLGLVATAKQIGGFMGTNVISGLAAASDLTRLSHVLVRSGWIPGLAYEHTGFETIDLAILEVLPLAGALAWLPVAASRRLRGGLDAATGRLREAVTDPVRQTDLLAGCLATTFLLVYLPYLPLHTTITVRYVVLAMPLGLYAVLRLGPIRAAIGEEFLRLVGAYIGTLLLGLLAVLGVLVALDPARGEAMQLHALANLTTALGLGAVTATWPLHRRARAVAVAIGITAGATTLFIALSALVYFTEGHHALDLVRIAAAVLENTR